MIRAVLTLILACADLTLRAQPTTARIRLPENARLTLVRTAFDSTVRGIQYQTTESGERYPYAVDGHRIFGTDGDVPRSRLAKATLSVGGRQYALPVTGMYNPWYGETPNRELIWFWRERTGRYRLRMLLSDGAGTYAAEWLLNGSAVTRTVLSADEEIVVRFQKGLRIAGQ